VTACPWVAAAREYLRVKYVQTALPCDFGRCHASSVPTFATTDELFAWMESEYLSELRLLSCSPQPKATTKKPPARVDLVLGLPDLEYQGAKDRYFTFSLRASGVARWEGAIEGDGELTVEAAGDADAPIAIRLQTGSSALLTCASVDVAKGKPKLLAPRPRPWQSSFHLECSSDDVTVATLHELLEMPALTMVHYDDPSAVTPREWTLASLTKQRLRPVFAFLVDGRHVGTAAFGFWRGPGFSLHVQRTPDTTDPEWDRLWTLPTKLGATRASSRTLATDGAAWASVDWRTGAPSQIFAGLTR